MKMCKNCGSTDLKSASKEDYDTFGREHEFYAYCECLNCDRLAEGWSEEDCIDLVTGEKDATQVCDAEIECKGNKKLSIAQV